MHQAGRTGESGGRLCNCTFYQPLAYLIALISVQTEIVIDASGSYYEVSSTQSQKKLEQAQINLNDCLACRCAM